MRGISPEGFSRYFDQFGVILNRDRGLVTARQKLTKLHLADQPISTEKVTLIHEAASRPKEEDCWQYIFPRLDQIVSIWEFLVLHGQPMHVPEEGYLAVYFDERARMKHIGKVVSGDTVVSKWANRGVYNHMAQYVPSIFGDRLLFMKLPYLPEEFIVNPEVLPLSNRRQ